MLNVAQAIKPRLSGWTLSMALSVCPSPTPFFSAIMGKGSVTGTPNFESFDANRKRDRIVAKRGCKPKLPASFGDVNLHFLLHMLLRSAFAGAQLSFLRVTRWRGDRAASALRRGVAWVCVAVGEGGEGGRGGRRGRGDKCAIMCPGRKSAFQSGFWPDCYGENTKISQNR